MSEKHVYSRLLTNQSTPSFQMITCKTMRTLMNETKNLKINILTGYAGDGVKRCTCGKNLRAGDITFTCLTCSNDVTTVYCEPCFLKSNHDGHHWYTKNTSYGQCDCGDTVAYKEESFCVDHKTKYIDPFVVLNEEDKIQLFLQIFAVFYQVHNNDSVNMTKALDAIEGSDLLLRVATLVCLCSGEDIPLQYFIDNCCNLEAVLLVNTPYDITNSSYFGLAASKEGNESDDFKRLYAEILPSDYYFRVGCLRQIGPYSANILRGHETAVATNLIQSINEPLGLYFNWGFQDMMSTAVTDLLIQLNTPEAFGDKFQNIQGMSYLKCLTSWYSIFFKSEHFLANYVRIQQHIVRNFSLDPNEHFDYGHTLTNTFGNFAAFYQMFFQQKNWRGLLRISENAEKKALSEAHIKINAVNPVLLQQVDHKHLDKQINWMLIEYFNNYITDDEFQQKPYQCFPAHFVQQFIIDVVTEYKLNLKQYINEIRAEYFKQYSEVQFVKKLIVPLIRQSLFFMFVENGLEYKQNEIDFGRLMSIFDRNNCFKIAQYESYYIVSQFILAFPFCTQTILDIFNEHFPHHDEILSDYIAILDFIPRPVYNLDFLKLMLCNQEFKQFTIREIQQKGYSDFYPVEDVLDVIKSLFERKTNLKPFESDIMEFKGYQFFEPSMFSGCLEASIQRMSEERNQPFIPDRALKQPAYGVALLFGKEYIADLCNTIINNYQQQKLGIGKALMACRLMRAIGRSLDAYEFRNAELYQFQSIQDSKVKVPAIPKINPVEKMKLLRQRQVGKDSALVRIIDKREHTEQSEECLVCHLPIEKDFVIPSANFVTALEYIDVTHFCFHKYHSRCIEKIKNTNGQKRCTICEFPISGTLSFGAGEDLSAIINSEIDLVTKIVNFNQSSTHVKQRITHEIAKLQFLVQNAKIYVPASPFHDQIYKVVEDNIRVSADSLLATMIYKCPPSPECERLIRYQFPKSTFYLIKQNLSRHCDACNKQIQLSMKDPLIICLRCSKPAHQKCCIKNKQFGCTCGFKFGFNVPTMTVVCSPKQIYKAPYRNKFGQYQLNLFSDENLFDPTISRELTLALACGDFSIVEASVMQQVFSMLPENPAIMQIIHLLRAQGMNPMDIELFLNQRGMGFLTGEDEGQQDEDEPQQEDGNQPVAAVAESSTETEEEEEEEGDEQFY